MNDTLPRMWGNRALAWTFGIALTLALAAQVNLQLTFAQVRHPVPLGSANLEADPEVVRAWYHVLIEQESYLQMIRTELVDFFWAILLAIALVSIYRLAGGLLRTVNPPIAGALYRWAPLAALGPAFDIVENMFSLAMLTDPFGFPAWWSYAHVTASWLKIVFSVASAVIGPTLSVVALVLARRRRGARNGAEAAVSPR